MRLRRQKTEKSALSAVEAMVRRRSIDSLGAPWRGLSRVFGACGLLLMPQAGICLKLCQLDLPRLDVANEVRNFNLYVLKMTHGELKSAKFSAARAFRRSATRF